MESECPFEHREAGTGKLFTPFKCAHLGTEWIALTLSDLGGSFTADLNPDLGHVLPPTFGRMNKICSWDEAEAALLNGTLVEYMKSLEE
jgi:hypothetical protein